MEKINTKKQDEFIEKLIKEGPEFLKSENTEPEYENVPCNNCQGCGCTTCGGFGYWPQLKSPQPK